MRRLPFPSAESELFELIEWARSGTHSIDEIAALARHLADSGVRLSWDSTLRMADFASSGGPGSLATLLCPIALGCAGCTVVKLGVPGRPAGAIDTLGMIPGYRIYLDIADVRQVVAATGFVQFLADEQFAPLDAKLFAVRKKVGAVAIPDLSIASSLCKKVAVGVNVLGMEVRVGRFGNLGTTRDEARIHARRFCQVASVLGIDAQAFLSAQDHVPQPWIGRGEMLVALATALGMYPLEDPWLREHVEECLAMAAFVGAPSLPLREFFERHLVGQGASLDAFLARVAEVVASDRSTIRSPRSGVLHVDLNTIRDSIVAAQADSGTVLRDPAGVQLLARPGSRVTGGQALAAVRGDAAVVGAIHAGFSISDVDEPPLDAIETVRAESSR